MQTKFKLEDYYGFFVLLLSSSCSNVVDWRPWRMLTLPWANILLIFFWYDVKFSQAFSKPKHMQFFIFKWTCAMLYTQMFMYEKNLYTKYHFFLFHRFFDYEELHSVCAIAMRTYKEIPEYSILFYSCNQITHM